jgi:hypothetical protein
MVKVDRRALGTLLRSAEAKNRLALDDLAAFATKVEREAFDGIPMMVLSLLFGPNREGYEFGDWDFLKLHGLLDPRQRTVLASGEALPLRSLGPDVHAHVERMLFGFGRQMSPDPEGAERRMNADTWNSFYSGLRGEPTELFPAGLLPEARLKLTREEREQVHAESDRNPNGTTTSQMSANDMAWRIANQDFARSNFPLESFSRFRWMRQVGMRYRILLGRDAVMESELTDTLEQGPAVDRMDKLPADFLKQVDALVQKIKEEQAKRPPPPPPPPAKQEKRPSRA